MKFKKVFEDVIDEAFDTKIEYNPIKTMDRIYQEFQLGDNIFIIEGDRFLYPEIGTNIWHIGFKNKTYNTYKLIGSGNPYKVYSIVAHWIKDFIKYVNVEYVLFGSHFDQSEDIFDKKNFTYSDIANRFLTDKIIRDKESEDRINKEATKHGGMFIVLKILD